LAASVTISSGVSGVQYLVYLRCIRLGIGQNVIPREGLAGFGFPCGITDHPGKIADNQDHVMPEFLKLPQFMQHDGVPEMDIRRGRVETKLDPQGFAGRRRALEFPPQLLNGDEIDSATLDHADLRIDANRLCHAL
jgi:hypothetical protein